MCHINTVRDFLKVQHFGEETSHSNIFLCLYLRPIGEKMTAACKRSRCSAGCTFFIAVFPHRNAAPGGCLVHLHEHARAANIFTRGNNTTETGLSQIPSIQFSSCNSHSHSSNSACRGGLMG